MKRMALRMVAGSRRTARRMARKIGTGLAQVADALDRLENERIRADEEAGIVPNHVRYGKWL